MLGEDGAPFTIPFRNVAFFVTEKCWVNNHAHVLSAVDIDPIFLTHSLNCVNYEPIVEGATREKLTQGNMNKIDLPIPSKLEQEIISKFLEEKTKMIDNKIHYSENLFLLLKEKRQSIINQAVTKGLDPSVPMKDSGIEWIGKIPEHWEIQKISKSVNKITNGYVGPTRDILVDKGVRYLQSTYVKQGKISFDGKYFVTHQWNLKHKKSILQEGDVLLVQTGANVGQCATVTKDYEGCNCHAMIIIQLKKELGTGLFLSYLLRSNFGKNMLKSMETGALHPHLEIGIIKNISLVLPTIDEQQKIVKFLDYEIEKIDGMILKIGSQIKKLKEFRQSLISSVVTGKVDVTSLAQ